MGKLDYNMPDFNFSGSGILNKIDYNMVPDLPNMNMPNMGMSVSGDALKNKFKNSVNYVGVESFSLL